MNLNANRLQEVIQRAFDATANSRRWQSAIVKAMQLLEAHALMHFSGGVLLLLSDSSEIYETTGRECFRVSGARREHCPAFAKGYPCKHRATHRLLTRYHEAGH